MRDCDLYQKNKSFVVRKRLNSEQVVRDKGEEVQSGIDQTERHWLTGERMARRRRRGESVNRREKRGVGRMGLVDVSFTYVFWP